MTIQSSSQASPSMPPVPPEAWVEDEIDLREYLLVLIAWWREIVLITVLTALAAAAVVLGMRLLLPPTYEATSVVAIAPVRSQVTFEERFRTLSEEDLQGLPTSTEQSARRQALLGLVRTGAVAQAVIDRLGDMLTEEERLPANLLEMVEAELAVQNGTRNADSDLIQIKVTADSPEKAAAIATAWGEEYVRHVNALYGQLPQDLVASVQAQLEDAQAAYDAAQRALEAFLAENRADQLQRQIEDKQAIIDGLYASRQAALTSLVDEEMKARQQIIEAYVNALATNQVLAFNKEQETKRALFNSLANADKDAKVAVYEQQIQDRIQRLSSLYAQRRKLERLLDDAQALRDQTATGQGASVSSNRLALLLLKAQAYATSTDLPGELQVAVDVANPLEEVDATTQLADLDGLIQAIQTRITQLDTEIATESQTLFNNAGYALLDARRPEADPLFTALLQHYRELFSVDELAALAEQMGEDTPLAQLRATRTQELLQQNLAVLPAYMAGADPVLEAINSLEAEIQKLQAQQEAEAAKKKELEQQRNLAWTTLTTLRNKATELRLASTATSTEVRFAAPAVEPTEPVKRAGLITTTALAGVVGLMLAIFIVFVAHMLEMEPPLARRQAEAGSPA